MELVEFIYSALTSRNVSSLKPNAGSEVGVSGPRHSPHCKYRCAVCVMSSSQVTPNYAKATTSNLIKENIKDSEVKMSETLATQAKGVPLRHYSVTDTILI